MKASCLAYSEANITCRLVTDVKVKGVNYEIGDESIDTVNAHCVVLVDGAWRIVDQYWGSESVAARARDDWILIAGRARRKTATSFLQSNQPTYGCNDFYFVPDPEQFIYSHWAPNDDDQLLARPVTLDEFMQMALLRQAFFEHGLVPTSHPKSRIELNADDRSQVSRAGRVSQSVPGSNRPIKAHPRFRLARISFKLQLSDQLNLSSI